MFILVQKRAPSDGQRSDSRLVDMNRGAVREGLARAVALFTTLGTLALLSLSGGASLSGW